MVLKADIGKGVNADSWILNFRNVQDIRVAVLSLIFVMSMVFLCSRQYWSQEQTHMPNWVLWFIFNLQIKKRSVTGISLHRYNRCTQWSFLCYQLNNWRIHIWVSSYCQICSEWVYPCSSLKADWVFLFTTWLRDAWTSSHVNGLAVLFSAWLAQILLWIKVLNVKNL
jgi:hypothetical protein